LFELDVNGSFLHALNLSSALFRDAPEKDVRVGGLLFCEQYLLLFRWHRIRRHQLGFRSRRLIDTGFIWWGVTGIFSALQIGSI